MNIFFPSVYADLLHLHLDQPSPRRNPYGEKFHNNQEDDQVECCCSFITDLSKFCRCNVFESLPFAGPGIQCASRSTVGEIVGNDNSEDGGEKGSEEAEEGYSRREDVEFAKFPRLNLKRQPNTFDSA